MNELVRSSGIGTGCSAAFTLFSAVPAQAATIDASQASESMGMATTVLALIVLFSFIAYLLLKRRSLHALGSLSNGSQGLSKINRFAFDQSQVVSEKGGGTTGIQSSGSSPAATSLPSDKSNSLEAYLEKVSEEIMALQRSVLECRRASDPEERQEALAEICTRLTDIKKQLATPYFRPAWELSTALEGLLKQLTHRDTNNTPSTLWTLENAVGLLGDLCEPGVRPDLADHPPIKILTADDDEVCRLALTSALKRTFEAPDVAPQGEAAVNLAKQNRYDLIMLDVMMPGMDGFEACAKIREEPTNRATPIVFVTALKDFESRSALIVRGGNEVVGKPFLASEITVKALSLILRARLRHVDSGLHVKRDSDSHNNPAVQWPEIKRPAAEEPKPSSQESPVYLDVKEKSAVSQTLLPPAVFEGSSRDISEKFLIYMSAFVKEMSEQVKDLLAIDAFALRMEVSLRLYLRFQCLSKALDVPSLHPAFSICRSIEGLLKKFSENPKHITETSVRTTTEALALLNELCKPGVRSDLVKEPLIRLLVVDDEPIARRALTGALQMGFSKPFEADTGNAALELAKTKNFDLIFMDVCMPGIDGFAACSQIHEISQNATTPVVFVTSLSDDAFRNRAAQSGGADYIIKPFIFMEINLKALTMILRGRLEKSRSGQAAPTKTMAAA